MESEWLSEMAPDKFPGNSNQWIGKGWYLLKQFKPHHFIDKKMPDQLKWPEIKFPEYLKPSPCYFGPVIMNGVEKFYIDRVVDIVNVRYPNYWNKYKTAYIVVWLGWGREWATIEPRENLNEQSIQEYLDIRDGYLPASTGTQNAILTGLKGFQNHFHRTFDESYEMMNYEIELLLDYQQKRTDIRFSRLNGFRW